ncbi:MAG TPA: hypothetical protein VNX00_06040 [Herbaspirillum sp.]|nr:hypothetical protein [Herbaspirillum sp.]
MTLAVKHIRPVLANFLENFGKPFIGAGLLALLAACGSAPSSTPVTESRPTTGTPTQAVESGAPWGAKLITGRFNCEMNNRVDVKMGDDQRHIDLTWKGRLYVMLPVTTSTGALRFEDSSSGMVWIQIPTKSMLLNSKLGQQVANECKV